MAKVAFQGETGAYSEDAAYQHFGNSITTAPCRDLRDVFEKVKKGEVEYGIVPMENSIGGSIVQSYDLLLGYNLKIFGEITFKIVHCLIANPNSKIESIKTVYSHPQALAKCRNYLDKLKLEVLSTYDTAGSVKMIKDKGLKDSAAIASEHSAKIYGLKVLARGIEDNPYNFTRFFIISKKESGHKKNCKTSIAFVIKHVPGTLHNALKAFAEHEINLAHIQSRPSVGKPWEYMFYADFEGHEEDAALRGAIKQLGKSCSFLRVLGSYPKIGQATKKELVKLEEGTDNFKKMQQKVAIIGGAGNMGKWFCNFFLKEGFDVTISGRKKDKCYRLAKEMPVKVADNNVDAIKQADLIILSVPLQNFKEVVKEIAPHIKNAQKIIDISSVKEPTVKIMHKYIKHGLVLGTHPLFGPSAESYDQNFVLTPTNEEEHKYANDLRKWLEDRGFNVSSMPPAKHDELMVLVLGLPHFIGLTVSDSLTKYDLHELEKTAGTSFKILLNLIRNVLSSDPEFYYHLQTILPKVSKTEKSFKGSIDKWLKIIDSKNKKEFIRGMTLLKSMFRIR